MVMESSNPSQSDKSQCIEKIIARLRERYVPSTATERSSDDISSRPPANPRDSENRVSLTSPPKETVSEEASTKVERSELQNEKISDHADLAFRQTYPRSILEIAIENTPTPRELQERSTNVENGVFKFLTNSGNSPVQPAPLPERPRVQDRSPVAKFPKLAPSFQNGDELAKDYGEHKLAKYSHSGFLNSQRILQSASSMRSHEDNTKPNQVTHCLPSVLRTRSLDACPISNNDPENDYAMTPIFSQIARSAIAATANIDADHSLFPQYGLLGRSDRSDHLTSNNFQSSDGPDSENDLVFTNGEIPWSAFICGSQGAGKSHTLTCLLENSLIHNAQFSRLPNPLAAMVFHYDSFSAQSSTQICEAAYLCTSGIPVRVLVSPSNIWSMTDMYTNLPGVGQDATKPKVVPLYLSEKQLKISSMMSLMAFSDDAIIPLYMELVHSVLREMALENRGGQTFSYKTFKERLQDTQFLGGQVAALNIRLQLLESFLEPDAYSKYSRPARAKEDIWNFEPGTLTIIDLSDPLVSENDACAFFTICLSIFMENRSQVGRVVALDEAHKFLTKCGESAKLTEQLTSIIRQQRHLATRVIISTQEPTLAPILVDLSNVTIVHRFLSPAWFGVLKDHLAGAAQKGNSNGASDELFRKIVALKTGEALLFSPTALLKVNSHKIPEQLGDSHLKIKIRNRASADGGKSILASDKRSTKQASSLIEIPMHIVVPGTSRHAGGLSLPPKVSSQPLRNPIGPLIQTQSTMKSPPSMGNTSNASSSTSATIVLQHLPGPHVQLPTTNVSSTNYQGSSPVGIKSPHKSKNQAVYVLPSHEKLESTLRRNVRNAFAAEKKPRQQPDIRAIRTTTERDLNMQPGKLGEKYNLNSQKIINDEYKKLKK